MPNPTQPRDIEADRERFKTLRIHFLWTYDRLWSFMLFCTEVLPHYLTRTAAAEKRVAEVEAMLDAMLGMFGSHEFMEKMSEPALNDITAYLESKMKEAEKPHA